ncbi:hypothetical protein CASFOL_042214 [Castilleja foliolosa]|uniref:Uncharacterized protein n=1 Tax=Castilleja foliolosa TaxID=1961234 RepID=A0ABD3BBB4_9LAMI
MNTRLAKVKRKIGEDMARKADKNKQLRKSNLPKEGVITEEILNNEEPTELLNQGARSDREVMDNLDAGNPTETGRGIENMDAADDAETVKEHTGVVNEEARPDNEDDAETVKGP